MSSSSSSVLICDSSLSLHCCFNPRSFADLRLVLETYFARPRFRRGMPSVEREDSPFLSLDVIGHVQVF